MHDRVASSTPRRTPALGAARVGIGGPVGSGKTALIERLIPILTGRGIDLAVVTNDLVTKEDAERLRRSGLIDPQRVSAVEAGACPHTVIREDPTLNIAAGDELERKFRGVELIIFESGGDNLASTFSLDLVDWWIFVIDVAGGDDIPRKRGPGVLRCDLRRSARGARGPADLGDQRPDRRRRCRGRRCHEPGRFVSLIRRLSAVLDAVARPDELLDAVRYSSPAAASLHFSRGGGRTVLARQRVPYPFHATRTFYLDRARPELATLYLQSASGGLYRGDSVALSIVANPHAAVHVTTQASTIVHRTHQRGVVQNTRIDVGEHAFLAMTPDPLVLFPGAEICCSTDITLAAGGRAILIDGLAHHDPEGLGRPFDRYSNAVIVRDTAGAVLLADRGSLTGEAMSGPASPLGPFRAVGTLFVLGDGWERCDADVLESRLAKLGCVAGLSKLPNYAGIGGRILAESGGVLASGLEAAFAVAFEALVGVPPARRRQ
jgi:urease accessory protein